jgi:CheY-like chemotaxis protein
MDLKLPKINGLEVVRCYKAHPQFKVVPVVVLTSSSEDKDIKTAYENGANSYIVKPVDFEKFLKVAADIELYWLATNQLPR